MEAAVLELSAAFQDAVHSLSRLMAMAAEDKATEPLPVAPASVEAALADFHGRAEFFKASCDSLQAVLENARHKLMCESLVDEARGMKAPQQGSTSAGTGPREATGVAGSGLELPAVLSALRLEQMSKAVRAIVQDLQQQQQQLQHHQQQPQVQQRT